MLQRCGLRLARKPLASGQILHGTLTYSYLRSSSTNPQRSRKLPGSEGNSRLKPWQTRFLIGLGAGLVISQAWLYYDRKQLRDSFVAYRLVAKEPVSSTASIFYLEPNEKSENFETYKQAWREGIWNVHFKQPQIQIVRAYTPLPPVEDAVDKDRQVLRFLIRHDPHGEVSSYLHRLPVGSNIELRGPNLEYQIKPDVRQVVFFAGGTGIAPALQIAHAMFERPSSQGPTSGTGNSRTLHILWANRKREDCLGGVSDATVDEPLPPKSTWSGLFTKQKPKIAAPVSEEKGIIVQELEELKKRYPGQVTVEYFVNQEGTWIDEEAVFRALSRFDDKDFSRGSPSLQELRQILISGPNGFITYLAGPKEWRGGREVQGNVSHILAHAIAQNPHHVKVWKV